MKLCTDTITVFNAKLDTTLDRDIYTGTVITGVSWFCEISTAIDSGLKAANKIIVRIPTDADCSGKRFVDPKTYASCDPAEVFTLHAGDIIVHGAAAEIDPKPSDLKELYAEITTVLGVTDNRRALHAPHWKVVGA